MSEKTTGVIVKGYASHYGTQLDSDGLAIWIKALENYTPEEVKRAFETHRLDKTINDFGKMVGEVWPRSLRIEMLIRQARNAPAMNRVQRGCGNRECASGWVTDYTNAKGVRFVKRCPECHPAASRVA